MNTHNIIIYDVIILTPSLILPCVKSSLTKYINKHFQALFKQFVEITCTGSFQIMEEGSEIS